MPGTGSEGGDGNLVPSSHLAVFSSELVFLLWSEKKETSPADTEVPGVRGGSEHTLSRESARVLCTHACHPSHMAQRLLPLRHLQPQLTEDTDSPPSLAGTGGHWPGRQSQPVPQLQAQLCLSNRSPTPRGHLVPQLPAPTTQRGARQDLSASEARRPRRAAAVRRETSSPGCARCPPHRDLAVSGPSAGRVQHYVLPSPAQHHPGPSLVLPELGLRSTKEAETLLCEPS